MRFRILGIVLGVVAVLLISSAVLAKFPTQGVGQGSSDIWVMNLHNTEDAAVVASYVDQAGNQETSVGEAIDPLGNTSFPASSSGLSDGWVGSMVLYSDRELASIAELFWRNVPKGDGWSGASYSGYSEGANELFFPYIMKTEHHKSIVTIQCVDTVNCDVSMTYRDRDGIEVTGNPFTDSIEPDSQESYDLWDPALNPNIPAQVDTPVPWWGALRVTSSQNIAGVAVVHYRQGYAAAYNAFVPGDDTEIYLPHVRRREGAKYFKDWTAIVVQNMNNYPVTVYHNYYDRTGGAPVVTFSDTIPAYASHGYNTRYGADVPDTTFDPMGTQFLGSAIISSTDSIVGVCTTLRKASGGLAGTFSGIPGGSSTLTFPRLYRTKSGRLWTGESGVIVQNVDPSSAAIVNTTWYHSDGSVAVQFQDTIPANSSHGYNTRYDAETPGGNSTLDPLGTNWAGTVIISTTSPSGIIGISQDHVRGSGYLYHAEYNAMAE